MLHHRYRARCTLCCADCSASCGARLLGSLLPFGLGLLQPLPQVPLLSFRLHLGLHALLQARFSSIELLLKSLDRTTVPILSAKPLAHVGEAGLTCLCTIRREDDVLKLQRLKLRSQATCGVTIWSRDVVKLGSIGVPGATSASMAAAPCAPSAVAAMTERAGECRGVRQRLGTRLSALRTHDWVHD